MKLFALLRRESTTSLTRLLFVAGVAGISNALVLAIVNSAATKAARDESNTRNLFLFLLVIAIYAITQWTLMATATAEVEKILERLRVRLADKIRRCELLPLEEIGRTAIYASINKETTTISHSAMVLVIAFQSAILVFFTSIYVASLSLVAFGLTLAMAIVVATIHLRRTAALSVQLHETMRRENVLFDALTDLLEGFKEVRMNRARSNDLFDDFREIAHSASIRKIDTQAEVAKMFIFSQASFYLLLGVIVFVVPRLSNTYRDDVVQITTAVLFLIGPISALVGSMPNVATADAAVENIEALEARLDRSLGEAADALPLQRFREIALEDVVFHYRDPAYGEAFGVGPIDLRIRAGETLFIAGGNGSGKSTFLRLLTALYHPQQGTIRVDGRLLGPDDYDAYRGLFATVFTDYHLFRRLYGIDAPQEEIDEQLELIEMEKKTAVIDGRFETLDLSAGQRKRLALLVSMLEHRPILVFDEMAADQDPGFRRKFYQEILPLLRSEGKTIIAVTHDDKYFKDADRLLTMEDGRIVGDVA